MLDRIYKLTNRIRKYNKTKEGLFFLKSLLGHKRVMIYFTQVSTRTFLSFQSACKILGMQTLEIRDPTTSSEQKGESIEDALRTFSSYVDLIIMRSPVSGLCDRIAEKLDTTPRSVPIINAGSGPDTHPTQAVLDVYTIMRSFRVEGEDAKKNICGVNGKTICFVGDLKRGRTVKALSKLLCLFKNIKMIFVSPKQFCIGDDLREHLKKSNIQFEETTKFEDAILRADIIYMTRLQDEYPDKNNNLSQDQLKTFVLQKRHLQLIRQNSIIMHPLPRRNEIEVSIDQDARAMYWRQERNGMWTRVALLTMIFGVDKQILDSI